MSLYMRQKIQTNTKYFRHAVSAWKAVIVSFCLDGLIILTREQFSLPPEFISIAHPLIVLSMLGAVGILLLPLAKQRMQLMAIARSKASQLFILIFLFICVALPVAEILLRMRVTAAVPTAFVAALVLFAFISSFRHSIKTLQSRKIPPRNRFLHIRRNDLKVAIVYLFGLIFARMTSILALILFAGGILDEMLFALLGAASMLLLMCMKPNPSRFFGVCPTCKNYRSQALNGLAVCPHCSKRPFYEMIKPSRRSSSWNF